MRATPGAALAVGAAVAAAALVACGSSPATGPTWAAGHPNTALVTFDTSAPGVCAITVQYPDEAPAAVEYLGGVYVQVRRDSRPGTAPAHLLGTSGDWRVYLDDARGEVLLVTPAAAYTYRLEAAC